MGRLWGDFNRDKKYWPLYTLALYEVSGAIIIFVVIIIIVIHSLKNKGQDFSKAAEVMPDKVIGVTKHWGHIIAFIQNSHCQDLLEKKSI